MSRLAVRRLLVPALVTCLAAVAPRAAGAAEGDADVQLAQGRALFVEHCVDCHGESGAGDGPTAKKVGFHPRDLAQGIFKCRCTPLSDVPTDADLVRTVTNGLDGSAMLGFGDEMSADEIAAVVAYVKTLSSRFEGAHPDCMTVPDPPAKADDMVAEGAQVFLILQCWQCHGPTGEGDGPLAKSLVDDWGDAIKPRKFSRPKFKCGADDRDLYRSIHTGLAGTPMAAYADQLAFGSDTAEVPAAAKKVIGSAAFEEARAFLAKQPDGATIAEMSEQQRQTLVERRTWSLVQFLHSLEGAGH